MSIAHLNIGSNLGDRLGHIGRAVAAIESRFNAAAHVSKPAYSEPWGYSSPNEFVNIGLNIEIGDTPPLELLATLQQIQYSIDPSPHRDSKGDYADRAIDIDIIAIDNFTLDTPQLTLPHQRMHRRRFVLEPLSEVWPQWIDPVTGMTASQLLDNLED